ncbi:uncharacterized protein LOC129971637 isoform X1 [Argiope bruennichi]|uniref:uncharacterized protein LOC129971637 isoform X1 n=1 Tax=Argiope bruennichi TaxID=94029 RepID=UPI002494B3D0|nr:uncharacterized protein LOC129971637 isoform X1 [Argiope bruennichi]
MWSKVIPSVVCIFSLLVVIQGKIPDASELGDYYQCFTYSECASDGNPHKGITHCFTGINDEDNEAIHDYIEKNFYSYHTDDPSKEIDIYCHLNGDEQRKAYEKTFNGVYSFQKMACSDKKQKRQCRSTKKLLKCFYRVLNDLKKKKYCE